MLHRTGLLAWTGPEGTGGRLWRRELRAPGGVLEAIRRVHGVQLDPVAVVERNHHLVLYNRVTGYRPEHLAPLYERRQVFEAYANARCVLPIELFPRFRLKMRAAELSDPGWRARLDEAVRYVLARLEAEGPLPSRRIESPERVMGYWDLRAPATKATAQALEHLWEVGDVVVASRDGDGRSYALARRWLPEPFRTCLDGEPGATWDDLVDHYISAFGVFDAGDFRFGWRKWPAARRRAAVEDRVGRGEIVPLRLDGVRRSYYVAAAEVPLLEALARAEVEPEVSLLPPLDNVLWRRERVQDLFAFDYVWEIYLPQARRRFGAYAMPVLEGDRFIGRLDPKFDRESGVLRINRLALEPGVRPDGPRRRRLAAALRAFARFHGAREIQVGATEPPGLNLPL